MTDLVQLKLKRILIFDFFSNATSMKILLETILSSLSKSVVRGIKRWATKFQMRLTTGSLLQLGTKTKHNNSWNVYQMQLLEHNNWTLAFKRGWNTFCTTLIEINATPWMQITNFSTCKQVTGYFKATNKL